MLSRLFRPPQRDAALVSSTSQAVGGRPLDVRSAPTCFPCSSRGLRRLRMQQHTDTGFLMQTAVLDEMKAAIEQRNTSKHEIDARRKQAVLAKNAAARKYDKRKAVRSRFSSWPDEDTAVKLLHTGSQLSVDGLLL